MLDSTIDQDSCTQQPPAATPRKARNAVVRDEGLRMIGEKRWLDPETANACKEMRREIMDARHPPARDLGLFFYLREPMLKDPTYLVAAWERGNDRPALFERYDTVAAALSAMQQFFRRAQVNHNATPWREMHSGDDWAWRCETRSAVEAGFLGREFY